MNPENIVTYEFVYEEVVERKETIDLPQELGEDRLWETINTYIQENKSKDTVHFELFEVYKK